MPIRFLTPAPGRPEVVEVVEARLGARLPEAFRTLLLTVSNGGSVEPVSSRSVPTVDLAAVFGAGREDSLDLERRWATHGGDRIAPGLLPVGDAAGGNLICLSLRRDDYGSVWYWDHELELGGDATTPVASDFDAFVADLTTGAPGAGIVPQVRSAWIDPEFRARFGRPPAT